MVVDHRALNKQTLSNHYPLSHVGDLFDQLVGASAFDLKNWHKDITKFGDQRKMAPKTVFKTSFGHYQRSLSFGFTNALTTL